MDIGAHESTYWYNEASRPVSKLVAREGYSKAMPADPLIPLLILVCVIALGIQALGLALAVVRPGQRFRGAKVIAFAAAAFLLGMSALVLRAVPGSAAYVLALPFALMAIVMAFVGWRIRRRLS